MRKALLLLGVVGLALALTLALLTLVRGARSPAAGPTATRPQVESGRPSASPAPELAPVSGQDAGPRASDAVEDRVALPLPPAPGLVGPHCSLWGRVLDGERAVPRFTLEVEPVQVRAATPDRRHDFVDAQGRFELELPEGRWRVRAVAGRRSTGEALEVGVPRLEELALQLVPTSSVSGRVLDPGGAPAAADVFSLAQSDAEDIVTSAQDGSFTLVILEAGRHRILAMRPDLAPSEPVAVELAAGDHVDGVELRLRAGARLHGRVLDRSGQPEAAVHVVLRAQSPNATRPGSAPTDASGAFELVGIPAGTWQVAVQEDQRGRGSSGPMRLALVELADGDDVELVLGGLLPEAVRVRGMVLAADGSPLTGVDLVTLAEGEGLLGSANQVELGADGRFDVLLAAPGRFVFGLADGDRLQAVPVQVPSAGLDDLVLRMPGGTIAGRVLDASGAPVRRAQVTAWRVEELGVLERFGEVEPTGAGDDGRFVLSGLAAGTWSLAAMDGLWVGSLNAPLPLASGASLEGVELRLVEGGWVQGLVVDVDGAPVARASVFARGPQGSWSLPLGAVTVETGRFAISLPPGPHTLLARAQAQASHESEPVEIASGATATVELVLVPSTRLELALFDARGALVPARFRVEDSTGRRMTGILAAQAGRELLREGFSTLEPRVGPFAPGTYRVIATADDGRTARAEVTLAGEPLRRLELRLE